MFRSISYSLGLVLLIAASGTIAFAQPGYTISTVAGSSNVGDGGPAIAGFLSQPEGIAIDSRGAIFIADANDHRVRKISNDGTIRTVAGSGIPGFTGDNGPSEAAQLNSPYGLSFDRQGNLYIADLGNARVRKIAPDGKITTVAGGGTVPPGGNGEGGPATAAKLSAPRNVTTDIQGNLYISDFDAQRVLKVDLSGTLTTVAGTGAAGYTGDGASALLATLSYPAGIATDHLGALYIADTGSKKIRRVYQGVISTVIGATPMALNVPTGLAVDRLDNLYIADNRTTMFRISRQGAVTTVPIGGTDVIVDNLDNVYTTGSHLVKRLTGTTISTIGGSATSGFSGDGGPATSARLDTPLGIATDPSGNVYLADSSNRRVRRISPQGNIATFAGTGTTAPLLGTQATSIRLSLPSAMAADNAGNVYISDATANRIRRILPDGTMITIAGADEAGLRGDDGPASRALLNNPTAIALDAENNLYIADTGNNRIRKITPGGQIATIAGGGASGADDSSALSALLNKPTGVATDAIGNVYISETGANRIRFLTRTGVLSTLAGAQANLNQPRGLRVTSTGDVIFADAGANLIRKLSAAGRLTILAGTGAAGFAGDGAAATGGQLSGPVDVALDTGGAIWISDTGNNRIRKLTPSTSLPIENPASLTSFTVTHGASLLEQAVAPGEIVTLFGAGLGPETGALGKLTAARTLETTVAGTQVLFDGNPAPLFFVQANQINAQVPYGIAGRLETEVTLMIGGAAKAKTRLNVKEAVPGLLTIAGGTGQAVALNQEGISNSVNDPATRGSIVTLYATGDGQLGPDAIDGKPYGAARTPYAVTVDFGGYSGEVLYAGRAPGFIGLMQINVRIPSQFVPSGPVPVVLMVRGETSQNGVFLHVR